MSIRVELTYEMSRALGVHNFEVEGAKTASDVVRMTRERFSSGGEEFGKLASIAGIAINGVLINHRRGMKTAVRDGDRVSFVKAAAGG